MAQILKIPKEKLVYVDETGFDTYLYREYARAPRGEKVAGKISGKRFKRTNLVAGKCGDKIIAPMTYDGTTDSILFETWFKQWLLPAVSKGSVMIMDNATFHNKSRLKTLAEEAQCKVLFLPPYSPDLNPIENFWAWLKRKLREILSSFNSFLLALMDCFQGV